jgi:hypothetical protein
MKKFYFDDLYVEWWVTDDDPMKNTGKVSARIWLKTDDPEQMKHRLYADMIFPMEMVDDDQLSNLIPFAKERVCLDLAEMNGDPPYTPEDALSEHSMNMREALEK